MIDKAADFFAGGYVAWGAFVGLLLAWLRIGPAAGVLSGFGVAAMLFGGPIAWWAAGPVIASPFVQHGDRDGGHNTRPPALPIAVSLLCAFALYACTPDTELARCLCGATLGAGAGAMWRRWSWSHAALAVTALLALGAVIDGRPRASAVVGGLGIAVVHALAQWRPPPRTLLAVVPVAMAGVGSYLCGRVAGLADSADIAIAVTVPTLLGVAGAAFWLQRAARLTTDGKP